MPLSPVLDVAYVGKVNRRINSHNHNPVVCVRLWILLYVSVHSGAWKTPQDSYQDIIRIRYEIKLENWHSQNACDQKGIEHNSSYQYEGLQTRG